MRDTILEVKLTSEMERSISAYYGTKRWLADVSREIGVKSCRYNAGVTTIEFASEAYKNWFILRWS